MKISQWEKIESIYNIGLIVFTISLQWLTRCTEKLQINIMIVVIVVVLFNLNPNTRTWGRGYIYNRFKAPRNCRYIYFSGGPIHNLHMQLRNKGRQNRLFLRTYINHWNKTVVPHLPIRCSFYYYMPVGTPLKRLFIASCFENKYSQFTPIETCDMTASRTEGIKARTRENKRKDTKENHQRRHISEYIKTLLYFLSTTP